MGKQALDVSKTYLGYPPVGLGDRRVLFVFRVDGQVYGHGRPSPPLFGVHITTGRWRQVLRIRPYRYVRWRSWRRLSRWWRRQRRRRFVHGPLPSVRPNLQQVQQADHLVEFVFLQRRQIHTHTHTHTWIQLNYYDEQNYVLLQVRFISVWIRIGWQCNLYRYLCRCYIYLILCIYLYITLFHIFRSRVMNVLILQ